MAIRKTANRGVLPVCSAIFAPAAQPFLRNAIQLAIWTHKEAELPTIPWLGQLQTSLRTGESCSALAPAGGERPLARCPYKF